ncbi:DNA methyltransferase [Kocuria sp. APC 4018]|uniref:site-specific DNA-methyltransferase n=1 Tax=unclassified Kocuria TaxID=2649579 RepID=UPI0025B58BE8|nr:DNA methyltransferase [Kocuria sp. APC 4018]MDN3461557.1 DNA methyltransferase [Kocuria sp. APC 4018]WIW69035.1 DNA methyltransferase [Kocuria sp. ChxB]
MSRLTELLRQARKADPQLGADLEAEIAALTKRRTFGLVFEQHQPEAVELPGRPVRRGDKVRVLPPRGETKTGDQRLWRVTRIERVDGQRLAHLAELDAEEPEACSVPADDVVVVAEFRDRIYPGLVETGRVEPGGDKPFHTVINAENYHALEMLTYTHRHSIDAIYIDPPYNTGAKDWKYNNDYVESDDDYRHSKWLAFIERRLKIARELLKPDDSVLIVTIDEKEYLRLGLLLEQTFPEARVTMVTSSINAAGATRKGTFARSAEYLYFVQFGESRPVALPLEDEWNPVRTKNKQDIYWSRLIRSGADSSRADSPNQFYPIFVRDTAEGPVFEGVGDAVIGTERGDVPVPDGCVAVWPIRKDGTEGRWRVGPAVLRGLVEAGHARLGGWRGESTTVYYLKQGEAKKVLDGTFPVLGHRPDGSVVTDSSDYRPRFVPTDLWRITSHDAGNSGTRLLANLLPGRRFPFPKSLYAVEDALRFFVAEKPGAKVLDFFSGSGTTAHAVIRLNREDGGRRQCISVTNNEVSADEQTRLRRQGLRPGDADWEALGICDHITKPRLTAAISGKTPEDAPINGEYRFNDEFPMSEGFVENAAFFTLTYEAPLSVRHNRAFERVAPMLWLRAGSRGRIIYDLGEDGWDVSESYGVLENLDQADEFVAAASAREGIEIAYVATDDDSAFQIVCRELPGKVVPVRLYESYLQNFEINSGRSL